MMSVNAAVLLNGSDPIQVRLMQYAQYGFGYVIVAAEYGQDISVMMDLNIKVSVSQTGILLPSFLLFFFQ